eukprot:scaffold11645_cov60-Phaeocystis_antarctica.AAC.5
MTGSLYSVVLVTNLLRLRPPVKAPARHLHLSMAPAISTTALPRACACGSSTCAAQSVLRGVHYSVKYTSPLPIEPAVGRARGEHAPPGTRFPCLPHSGAVPFIPWPPTP